MNFRQAIRDLGHFLTFRATPEMYDRIGVEHAVLGFTTTWLVGIARNWDYPDAPYVARAGLGSLAYIFVLALVLFVMAWPISYEKRNYWHVLTAISMTAGPGLVYGIPVEMFMSVEGAQGANLIFLLIVAAWRVALASHYLFRGCQNGIREVLAILLLPISLIVIALVSTGRAGYVMQFMGGLRRDQSAPNATVDEAIATLYCLAWPLGALAALFYLIRLIQIRLGDE